MICTLYPATDNNFQALANMIFELYFVSRRIKSGAEEYIILMNIVTQLGGLRRINYVSMYSYFIIQVEQMD